MRPTIAKSWRGDLTENPYPERDYLAIAGMFAQRRATWPQYHQVIMISMEPGEVAITPSTAPAYAWDLYPLKKIEDGDRHGGGRRVGQFLESSRSRGIVVFEDEGVTVIQMLPERFTQFQGTKRIKGFNLE
jgi:hypothetical protein